MTYEDLRVALDKLSPEQLECDVTVCQDNGEFFDMGCIPRVGGDSMMGFLNNWSNITKVIGRCHKKLVKIFYGHGWQARNQNSPKPFQRIQSDLSYQLKTIHRRSVY